MFLLQDKVAVITGSASGFGRAAALRFSRAGAKVVLADIQDGSELVKETGGIFMKTDVSQEEQVEALMQAAVSEYGKLDVVINNAGIGGVGADIKDIKEEDFELVYSVNTKGVLWGIKHAVPHISDGGSIINTSSYGGLFGFPSYGSYTASKFAIVGITKTAALELAPRRIRVNCVCPGTFDTPINKPEIAEVELKIARFLHPLGRIGQPEEVAALFHYLASDESAFITGAAICIDAGMSAGIGLGIIEQLVEKVTVE